MSTLKSKLLISCLCLVTILNPCLAFSSEQCIATFVETPQSDDQKFVEELTGEPLDIPEIFADLPRTEFLPATQVAEIERNAFDVLEKAVEAMNPGKLDGDPAVNAVDEWSKSLPTLENPFRSYSVREHIALSYLLRSGLFDKFPNTHIEERLKSALSLSWTHLTGKTVAEDKLLGRLPRMILAKSSRENQILHSASFQIADLETNRAPFAFGKDYIPKMKDLWAGVILTGIAFTSLGRQLIGRAILASFIATAAEYSIHRYIGHAPAKFVALFKKAGHFGVIMKRSFMSHIIHHRLANTNYSNVSEPTNEKDIAFIKRQTDEIPGLEKQLKSTGYGKSLDKSSLFSLIMMTLPISYTVSLFLGYGQAVIVGTLIPTLLIGGASKIMHPYLHLSKEMALEQSSGFLRWVLQTRFAEFISAFHHVHHNGGVGANYNLIPGADFMVRFISQIFNAANSLDAATKPNLKMIMDMGKRGLIGGVRRE